jgi:hypothetical protein
MDGDSRGGAAVSVRESVAKCTLRNLDSNKHSGACTVVVAQYSLPLYFPNEISHISSFTILELKNLNRFGVDESKMMVEITALVIKAVKSRTNSAFPPRVFLMYRKRHDPISHDEHEILFQSIR